MKKYTYQLTTLFCLFFTLINAQIGFKEHLVTSEEFETASSSIFTVDIDGDSDLDVVTTSKGGLTYFENLDNFLNFKLHFIDKEFDEIYDLNVADLDGDGTLDIVASLEYRLHLGGRSWRTERKLVWYKNKDGKGNFGAPIVIPLEEYYNNGAKIAVSDVDGDNDKDIIFRFIKKDSNYKDFSNSIWLENTNGKGNFSIRHDINTSKGYTSIAKKTSDIDGDGDQDFVFFDTNDDTLKYYKNTDGKGNFSVVEIEKNIDAYLIQVADLDQDGDQDIMTLSTKNKEIYWYKNTDGKGDFSSRILIKSSHDNLSLRLIQLNDMDGDNDLDLIFSSTSFKDYSHTIYWKENTDGLGTFDTEHTITNIYSDVSPIQINANDMDNDGDIDIVMSAYDGFSSSREGKLFWLENNDGLGNFNAGINISNFPDKVSYALTIDINNDGDKDIISSTHRDDEIVFFENLNGKGYFSNQIILEENINGTIVAVGDIDNDGDDDFIFYATTSNQVDIFFYENLSINSVDFKKHRIASARFENHFFKTRFENHLLKDLDGDRDLDLLVSKRESGWNSKMEWIWFKNDGSGNFEEQNIIFTSGIVHGYNAHSLVDDIDGDGNLDLIIAYGGRSSSKNDHKFTCLKNNGDFINFSEEQTIIDFPDRGKIELYTEDVDNDGDIDFLYIQGRGLFLVKNKNNTGEFEEPKFLNGDINDFLTLSDMDNDGDLDIITAKKSFTNSMVSWYENLDGLGTYGTLQVISNSNNNPGHIDIADIDGDGDQDIITTSYNDSKIIWHENIGKVALDPLKNGLIAYYPFNGNTNDETRFKNNGFASGARLTTDLMENTNSAYFFDGNNDLISANHTSNLHLEEDFTLSAFVYLEEQKTQEIIRKGAVVNGQFRSPYQLAFSETGDIIFQVITQTDDQEVRVRGYDIKKWQLLTAVREDNDLRLYINGKLIGSNKISGTTIEEDSRLQIGSRLQLPSSTVHGKIDEVRIYNRALPQEEIKLLLKDTPLSINDHFEKYNFSLYPNPAKQVLKIRSKTPISKTSIYDLKGRIISNYEFFSVNEVDYSLNIENLSNGMYFLEILSDKKRHRIKFIKE